MRGVRVAHVHDRVDGGVYIGRAMPGRTGSVFANPFKLRRGASVDERRQCVQRYADWLRARPELLARLPALRGATVQCWCRHDGQARTPETLCHGDVINRFLVAYSDEELAAMRR